jgi:ribosomal protein S15P/S13E
LNIKVAYLSFGLAFLIQLVYLTSYIKDIGHHVEINKQDINWNRDRVNSVAQEQRARTGNVYKVENLERRMNGLEALTNGSHK